MQKIKLRTEESGKKLSAAYAPPKWSETAEEEEPKQERVQNYTSVQECAVIETDLCLSVYVKQNTDIFMRS